MDWKREAADELRNYMNRKAAIENISDQIADLATEITSIRSASADGSRSPAARTAGTMRSSTTS